jgi:dTDP-L-rhamnose 4-epimerase
VFHQAAAVGVGQSMYQIEHYVSVNAVGAAVLLEGIVERRQQLRKLVVASSMSIYGEGAYQAPDGRRVHPPLRTEAALAARRFELYEAAEPPIPGAAEPPIPGHGGQELVPLGTPEEKPLQPTSIYAITKRDHEEMFLAVGAAYDIPVVALRYFNVYGPRQALSNPYTGVVAIFCSRLLNRRPPLVYEDGRQTRDFVHVSDIVQANLLALDSEAAGGRIYNVGTGRATSVLQVAETLSELLDFGEKPEVLGQYRAGDIRHCVADISRIQRELGYRPRVVFADGLRELLAWLRTQSPDDAVEAAGRELAARGLTR